MMTDKEIKQYIKKRYGINGNAKIKLHPERFEFTIRLGDCLAQIPYPKELRRDLLLEKLLT